MDSHAWLPKLPSKSACGGTSVALRSDNTTTSVVNSGTPTHDAEVLRHRLSKFHALFPKSTSFLVPNLQNLLVEVISPQNISMVDRHRSSSPHYVSLSSTFLGGVIFSYLVFVRVFSQAVECGLLYLVPATLKLRRP